MPSSGQIDHDIEHFFYHFRIKGRGRLIKQHDFGLHAQTAGNRHPLLLAAGKLTGIFVCLLGNMHVLQVVHGHLFGLFFGCFAHPDRSQRQVFQDRQVGKEVEVLEDHADFGTDLLDVFHVVGQFDAVDDDLAALVLFQPVDAADQGRLARTGRAADHNPFLRVNLQG